MNREQITDILLQRADALRAIGATSLYMFGSRARGDNRPDSDLDLFIDFDPERLIPSAFRLMDFEKDVEIQLGIHVEIATRSDFHAYIRKNIEQDAFQVF